MNIYAMPNRLTRWPSVNSGFNTSIFEDNYDAGYGLTGVDFVKGILETKSVKDAIVIVDFSIRTGKGGWKAPKSRDVLYVCSFFERLTRLRGLKATSVAYIRNSKDFFMMFQEMEKMNGISLISELGISFDLTVFDKAPPMRVGDFVAPKGATGFTVNLNKEKSLQPNPFHSNERIEQIHEVRRQLHTLCQDLSSVNDDSGWDFERADLVALLKQALVQIGDGNDIPPSAESSIQENAKALSERILRMEKLSTASRKIVESIDELLKFLLSFW